MTISIFHLLGGCIAMLAIGFVAGVIVGRKNAKQVDRVNQVVEDLKAATKKLP